MECDEVTIFSLPPFGLSPSIHCSTGFPLLTRIAVGSLLSLSNQQNTKLKIRLTMRFLSGVCSTLTILSAANAAVLRGSVGSDSHSRLLTVSDRSHSNSIDVGATKEDSNFDNFVYMSVCYLYTPFCVENRPTTMPTAETS